MSDRDLLRTLPREELLAGGHGGMPGCGTAIALRQALKALGPRTVLCVASGALAMAVSQDLRTAVRVPLVYCPFESSVAIASGVKAALEARRKVEVSVVSWAGGAGGADGSLQALFGAAERSEEIIHICCDDESYPGAEGQARSPVPVRAVAPPQPKKDLLALMAAHGAPYVASASIAFPGDFIAKLRKMKAVRGFRYLHVLAPQPEGWGYPSELTIRMARMAVETSLWPLEEIEGGERRFTYRPPQWILVRDYLRAQRRFDRITDREIEALQAALDRYQDSASRLSVPRPLALGPAYDAEEE